MTSRNPTLAEIANAAAQSALDELFVSLPGRVVRYDAATQSVDVQPIPKVRHADEDGALVVESLPVVPSVPVVFPGGGGFTITFPISVGDTVLLVFSGCSIDKWLQAGTDEALDPEAHTRHALADAVAIPGLKNFRRPRESAPTDHVRIGVDGADTQGVALGADLKSYLDDLKTYIAGHTHTGVTTGGGVSGTPSPSPSAPTVPALESATVKVTE